MPAQTEHDDLVHLIGFAATKDDLTSLHDRLETQPPARGPLPLMLNDAGDALDDLTDAHAVLVAAASKATVFPVRQGTMVPREKLDEVAAAQTSLAERFDGLCEARIVARYKEDEIAEELASSAFKDGNADQLSDMEKGRLIAEQMKRVRAKDQDALLEALAEISKQIADPHVSDPWDMARISVLVPLAQLDQLEDLLTKLAKERLPRCRFEMTAPLPLYSFV